MGIGIEKSNTFPLFGVKVFLGVLTLILYLLGVLRQKSTVVLIELPCFVFCAMMNAEKGLGACLRYWMTIGK